jgi:hypothetical protein
MDEYINRISSLSRNFSVLYSSVQNLISNAGGFQGFASHYYGVTLELKI